MVAFAALGWFYLIVLPGWLGLPTAGLDVSAWDIARSVLIFLGIPLLAGYLTRRIGCSLDWHCRPAGVQRLRGFGKTLRRDPEE